MTPEPGAQDTPLVEAHLGLAARRRDGDLDLIRDWRLRLEPGGTLGLVGESGSGKTLCAMALTGLLPAGVRIAPGSSIRFEGRELVDASARALREVRGRRIGVVFQHPGRSLNPMRSVGAHLEEVLIHGLGLERMSARARARRLLEEVELEHVDRVLSALPDELSGGMAQRVGIALALALDPALLIADEPTSALDGSVRRRILALLARVRATRDMGLLLISHDLAVVAAACERVAVQYAGRVVEEGPVAQVLARPRHPYTRALRAALPSLRSQTLPDPLPGAVPSLGSPISGCVFRGRCAEAGQRCADVPPEVTEDDVRYRCWMGMPGAVGIPDRKEPRTGPAPPASTGRHAAGEDAPHA